MTNRPRQRIELYTLIIHIYNGIVTYNVNLDSYINEKLLY